MPVTVIDDQMTKGTVTATFRRRRPGPETELIDWFLHVWPVKIPKGCRATVFREPRLESGFPDLVFVIWNIDAAKQWKPIRASLKRHDIRVMQYIIHTKKTELSTLKEVFSSSVTKSLDKLEEAEMIQRIGKRWKARPLSQVFAAQHIVSIEAKISKWAAAIEQASLNTWFASSSYVLMPHIPRNCEVLDSALQRGIGVWTKSDTTKPCSIPETRRLPLSYASWLFNEWSCHHAWHGDEEETPGL